MPISASRSSASASCDESEHVRPDDDADEDEGDDERLFGAVGEEGDDARDGEDGGGQAEGVELELHDHTLARAGCGRVSAGELQKT